MPGLGDTGSSLDAGELFRVMTEYSPDVISLLDADGHMLFNSPASLRLHGYTPDELHGKALLDFVHPEDAARVAQAFASLVATPGGVQSLCYRLRAREGAWRWVEVVVTNQLDNPAVRAIVSNRRDITERREAEELERRRAAELIEGQRKEALVALAGGIAHDFNNVLAIIVSEANLLRAGSANTQEAGKTIELAASRANDLTRLLLAYAGRGQFELEPTFLPDLVHESAGLLQMTTRPGAQFVIDAPLVLPAVDIDRNQVRQAVLNLVQNAVESLEGRAGKVSLRLGEVHLTEERLVRARVRGDLGPGPAVVLEVRDTGCGMSPETLHRLTEPFFSTRRADRGLGLAAVAGIVRGHHAALEVESEEHVGSTFRLFFAPTAQAPRPLAAPDTRLPMLKLEGRALIIDDEPMISRSTRRMLEKVGLKADQAWDGQDALNRFGGSLEQYAVVILDMVMPRLNGAETFARLRRLRPSLPVVMYSGFDDHLSSPCLREPHTAFVAKPFTVQRLVDGIVRATR